MSEHLSDEDLQKIQDRCDARFDNPMNHAMFISMSRTYVTQSLEEVERLRSKNGQLMTDVKGEFNPEVLNKSLTKKCHCYEDALRYIRREVLDMAHGDLSTHIGLQMVSDKIVETLG